MDPALWELLEGDHEEEIEAIIRLAPHEPPPAGVRLITRFGDIATCRMARGDIIEVRAAAPVVSLKAPRLVSPEPGVAGFGGGDTAGSGSLRDVRRPTGLEPAGRGIVVGVVDWGCDFAHPDFLHGDGSTRLLALWDQSAPRSSESPQPYGYGQVHGPADIDQALETGDAYTALGYHPADGDPGGIGAHGTHVLSIAAGNGRGGGPMGLAPEADLVFVHMATRHTGGLANLGNSVTLLEAIDFIARTAGERPCVINASIGRHGGPHDGSTLVEQGFDNFVTSRPGRCIVQSCGNYYDQKIHAAGILATGERQVLRWVVDPADVTPNELEVWYPGQDRFAVEIALSHRGPPLRLRQGESARLLVAGREVGRAYHRRRDPNNAKHHINLFLDADGPAGIWEVRLLGEAVTDGRYHAWVERDPGCPGCQSRFQRDGSDPMYTTGTICNGFRTIAVGAYDAHSHGRSIARFSSSGPTVDGRQKPDCLAPGVRVLAARSAPPGASSGQSSYTRMSGTSMAAPHVTGAVACVYEAAERPLTIDELRAAVLGSADAVRPDKPRARVGAGYLDVVSAIHAVRTPRLHLAPHREDKMGMNGHHRSPTTQLEPAEGAGHPAGRYILELDGMPAGALVDLEGGEPVGEVVETPPGPDRIVRKHIGRIVYTPIVLTCGTGLTEAFYSWLGSFLAGQEQSKSGHVFITDQNNKARFQFTFTKARISEIAFPELAAGSKTAARLRVTLTPEETRMDKGDGSLIVPPLARSSKQTPWLAANFRVRIKGMHFTKVKKVESIVVRSSAPGAALQVPSILITVPPDEEFLHWFSEFLIRGKNDASQERDGTVEFLDPSLKNTLFTLTLRHLGIVTIRRRTDDNVMWHTVEMYCEEMGFTPAASATAATLVVTPGPGVVKSSPNMGRVKPGQLAVLNPNAGDFLDPAAMFDAFVYGRPVGLRRYYERFFDVVAGPGDSVQEPLRGDDLLVCRGLGEAGLAQMFTLATGEAVQASDGFFVEVLEERPSRFSGERRIARRLTGGGDRVGHDRIVLRWRQAPHTEAAEIESVAPVIHGCRPGEGPPTAEPDPTGRGPHPLLKRGTNPAHSRRPSVGYAQGCLNNWLAQHGDGSGCRATDAATRAFIDRQLATLRANGQLPLDVDCRFGPSTESATKAFQACMTIDRDGKIGPVTWPLLKQFESTLPPLQVASALLIEPDTFVVAVPKPHTSPPRVRLVLRSSTPLATPVILTRTFTGTAPSIRFFTAPTGGVEITFDGRDNVFSPAQITANLEIWAEGASPSPIPGDVALLLAPHLVSLPGTPGGARGTAVAATVDICLSRAASGADPATLSEADKVATGRAVQVADPGFSHERAMLIVRPPQPPGTGVTLVVTPINSTVGLFTQEPPAGGQTAVPTPLEIPESSIPAGGVRLFVEGTRVSSAARDTGVRLGIKTVADEADRVVMTSVQVDAVENALPAAPPLTSTRFGLWDRAYDGTGNVHNGVAEADNFIGRDRRKFHLRVNDPASSGGSVDVDWRTLRADGATADDAPANQTITLPPLVPGAREFVSRAVMLVTDNTDRVFPTNSGLAAPFDAGDRAAGQSNHRTRRASIDGFTRVEYTPQAGVRLGTRLPVFQRSPGDERLRVTVRVIRYTGGAAAPNMPVATPQEIQRQFAFANARWNAVGLQIDQGPTLDRVVPAGALNSNSQYAGVDPPGNPFEHAALADLIPFTPDNTVTAVWVDMPDNGPAAANAYTNLGAASATIPVPGGAPLSVGDRFFVFIQPGLNVEKQTLAHELHHVLFNRFDGGVPAAVLHFFTFDTREPTGQLPNVRTYRRVHQRHSPDPNNDPGRNNVVNWVGRRRSARFPEAGGVGPAATATTGNNLTRQF